MVSPSELGLKTAIKSSVFSKMYEQQIKKYPMLLNHPPEHLFSEQLSMGASLCPCAHHCSEKRYHQG